VFGWIPTLEPGGEVGLGVKATFQHERDEDEGKEDEAVAARLGGGHASGDSAHGDAAKEASAKMARLREAQARAAREQAALDACGAPEYTLTVLEATPGGAAAKAGLIGGQRISAVNEVTASLGAFFSTINLCPSPCFVYSRPARSSIVLLISSQNRMNSSNQL